MIDKKKWINSEREYHDRTVEQYVEKYGKAKQHQIPEEVFLFRYLPHNRKSLIVDVGCGPSIFISDKLKKFMIPPTYIGIDMSEELIKIAKKNFPKGIFIIADGSEIPLKDSVADFVISLGGLHHIPDIENTITYLLKILKPGGHLLIREPSPEAFRENWKGESPMERGISPEEIMSIIKDQKAILVDYRRFNSNLFNSFRHLLHITRIYRLLEWSDLYWKIKTYLDSALSAAFGSILPYLRGLDFCMVVKKK